MAVPGATLDVSMYPGSIEWKSDPDDGVILVTGSRGWKNISEMAKVLAEYRDAALAAGKRPVLIHGAAQGADSMAAAIWSDQWGLASVSVPADWKTHTPERCRCHDDATATYCRVAGIVRNEKMVDVYHPDVTLAFFQGDTNGTQHCSDYAKEQGIPVRRVYALDGTPVAQAAKPVQPPTFAEAAATAK